MGISLVRTVDCGQLQKFRVLSNNAIGTLSLWSICCTQLCRLRTRIVHKQMSPTCFDPKFVIRPVDFFCPALLAEIVIGSAK